MMTPQLILWLIWTLCTAGMPTVRTDFSPYDGPLAERQVELANRNWSSMFEFPADTPTTAALRRALLTDPIHVLAPGHRYTGWGLTAFADYPRDILLINFNTLLVPTDALHVAYAADNGAGLAWAFSVLDHYGIPYDPRDDEWDDTRDELIASYRQGHDPIDWQAVADRLRATGRPVPDDLFDQPAR